MAADEMPFNRAGDHALGWQYASLTNRPAIGLKQARATRTWIPLRCSPTFTDRRGSCGIGVSTPPDTPDLATYSQAEQFEAGAPLSWDSPDILTNAFGPWRLLEEVRVRVRNLSPTASAVNVLVHLFRAQFGIGTTRTLETTQGVNLAPLEERQLFIALSQATLAGDQRIGVHALIEHPHDQQGINNEGAQIVFGALTSEVGRTPQFTFPARNPVEQPEQMSFSVLPNDLGGVVSPTSHAFAPFEEIQASLSLTVPGNLPGPSGQATREVTVLARAGDGRLIDGVTHVLIVDS